MKLNINRTTHTIIGVLASITLCIIHSGILRAQKAEDDTAKHQGKRRGFVGAPYVEYSPETGWVGGLVGFYYFELSSDSALRTRPSNVSGGASYSQKHQSTFGVNYNVYFPGNSYLLAGGFHYQQFPLYFFGDGNNTPANNIDLYTPSIAGLHSNL